MSGYRDDRDALRDQVRRLEQRLHEADHEVALLRGDAPSSAVDSVGALRPLALDRVVARPLSERRATELERLWRARLPTGMRIERSSPRVTAETTGLSLVAEVDPGGTRLRMSEDLRPFRRVWALLAVSITLTLVTVVPTMLRASGAVAGFAAAAAALALLAFPLAALMAKRRRRELARIFEASAFLLSEDEARGNHVRVASEAEADRDAQAIEESEHDEDPRHVGAE